MFGRLADEAVVALEPFVPDTLAVAVVVTAVRRLTTVHTDTVKVVNFIRYFGDVIRVVHCSVHMFLQIERSWVLNLSRNFPAKDVEPFDGHHKNPRCHLDAQRLSCVLLLFTNGAQVLVVLGELVNTEELFEGLLEGAHVCGGQRHIESKRFVKSVRFVITLLTQNLGPELATEEFEQGCL